MNANGFIVQDYNQRWYVPDKYNYMGISAFVTFPLDLINKASARELAKRQQTRTLGEQHEMLEFISDKSLLNLSKELNNQQPPTLTIIREYVPEEKYSFPPL